ncbi:DUF5711 family protein [Paramaledivibacter caminithermalis]|uniref:PQQ-like domain-containing protein n=1 Tax=Paramaledivibacter caminithermalis (strain DSM 15212 / CIP 107654 / DViRD3) TaxID=1121301 RepID=A0A1M6NDN9_PARC5|nr:DUF5711 family protein [Paramaledivibacter caminithermalis]SHJ93827.1 hypothetical protein SAMN02745912_01696 [Paramaledivibacter caminithermalis DSM 15212]
MAKKKKGLNRTRFLIFSMVIASMLFGAVKLVHFVIPSFVNKDVNLKRINTINYSNRKDKDRKINIESFNEHICKFEEGKLSTYNEEGEMLWEKKLDIEEAIIKGNQNNIVIADSSGGDIYYINYEGEIKIQNNLEKAIIDMKINESGHALVMLEKEIYVFNPDGEIISNFTIPKGEVIDGDLSPDNSTIALTILAVEEKKFYSNILFYSLEGKVLSGKKFDNIVIYKIFLINNENLLVLGDSSILMLTKDNNILWKKNFQETINRGVLNNQGLLVLNLVDKKNTIIDTKNRNTISQLDLEGNILNKTPIVGEILGLDIGEDKLGVFTDRTIYIIDKKGNKVLEKKINGDIKNINWVSKRNLLIVYKDKLEVMEMNY